jgi:hypothetical protein
MFENRDWTGKVLRQDGKRVIVLPDELVLEGEDIAIMQDRWGDISIHPTSPEGLKAKEQFGPLVPADWKDDGNGTDG